MKATDWETLCFLISDKAPLLRKNSCKSLRDTQLNLKTGKTIRITWSPFKNTVDLNNVLLKNQWVNGEIKEQT